MAFQDPHPNAHYAFAPSVNPVLEQSTLVYTLLDDEQISWSEFSLIVRSLHSYKVTSTEESPEHKTITVVVGYFANLGNAQKRLGRAAEFISVGRMSSSVQPSELQTLSMLKRKFGFGRDNEEEEPSPPKSTKGKKATRYAPRN